MKNQSFESKPEPDIGPKTVIEPETPSVTVLQPEPELVQGIEVDPFRDRDLE